MVLRWLLPLGFLGLLGIAALFAVYLFRPQYKQKVISGTVIWKRVLLRNKSRRPAFNHVLLFLLQALVIAVLAAGLAQPRLYSSRALLEDEEYILVLDCSASMRAGSLTQNGRTRFERAVDMAKQQVDQLFSGAANGTVSLIVADDDPEYLFSDLNKSNRDQIFEMLNSLSCTLGEGDLTGALQRAGSRLEYNPYAKIFLFTDTSFGSLGTAVQVINVANAAEEQNVAVLGCTVGRQDNQYVFEIVLGAYGNITMQRNVNIDILGADNGLGPRDYHLQVPVTFAVDQNSLKQVVRLTVSATDEEYGGRPDWFFEQYDELKISIPDLNDSIPDDDEYLVYGGLRDRIKVQYWSKASKIFWQYGFKNLANNMSIARNISFNEIYWQQGMTAQNSGYDIYVFEHSVPEEILEGGLPEDGIVILADPDQTLSSLSLGLTLGEEVSLGGLTYCTAESHPLIRYMEPSRIGLTRYNRLTVADNSQFKPLLWVNGDPAMLVKEDFSSKIVVMPFSINMSDFYGDQFQIFLYNIINHFMPLTLTKSDFLPGESVQLECKGQTLRVSFGDQSQTFGQFPAQYTFDKAGTYTFTTDFSSGKQSEVRKAYVHPSSAESELFASSDLTLAINNRSLSTQTGMDIFIWLAAAALVLMAVEWCIQYKYIP